MVKIPMRQLDLCDDSSVEWAQGSVGDPKSIPRQKAIISSRQIYSKCLDAFKPTDSTQWVFWRLKGLHRSHLLRIGTKLLIDI